MVSFIIVAKEKKKREAYAKEHAKKHTIDIFDITVIAKDPESKTNTQSIGIETVKLIQKKLYFKPIKSPYKLLIIEDAQLLTPEAQNALLKVLEEPPANTHIMLGTESIETLLPTIQSRCQIIILEEEKKELSEKMIEELSTFIATLPELTIGEKLKHAEQLAKDKEKALVWIENIIFMLRGQLMQFYIQNENPQSAIRNPHINILKSFQSLHTLLQTTNVNPRFAIERTLLSL